MLFRSDKDIDLRLENYFEGLVYEKMNQKDRATKKYEKVIAANHFRKNQVNDLVTALALKRVNKLDEAEKLLEDWKASYPSSQTAEWAYAAFQGQDTEADPADNSTARILQRVIKLR